MNIDLAQMNDDLEQLRVELGAKCLAVNINEAECYAFLHYDTIAVRGAGDTLRDALIDAVAGNAIALTEKLSNGDQSNG